MTMSAPWERHCRALLAALLLWTVPVPGRAADPPPTETVPAEKALSEEERAAQAETERLLELAEALDEAITTFQAGDFTAAEHRFETIRLQVPDHASAAYYLGLLALRRQDNADTIRHWQRLARVDPEAAESLGIPRRLTLLLDEQRKIELSRLLDNEATLSRRPVETGSIAVVPLSNRSDEKYAVLAKGLTALIIADLSKVPGIKVLERGKIQKLLDEMKRSRSGLTDRETHVRTGRLLKAEKLISGDYSIQ